MTEFEEQRVYEIELRDVDVAKRTMVGLAAPYNVEAAIGGAYIEVLAPGVFKKSIQEAARALPLHMFHDHTVFPVGKAVEWQETKRGLVGTWEFMPEGVDELADKAYRFAQEGFTNGLSVGFQPIKSDINPGTDTRPPTIIRREARMFETSIVTAPAYASAQIMLVRTAGIVAKNRPHFDRWREWMESNR